MRTWPRPGQPIFLQPGYNHNNLKYSGNNSLIRASTEWVHAKSLHLSPDTTNLMGCSQPGSSVHGIVQARILECIAMPSSRGSSRPRDPTYVSYFSTVRRVLCHWQHLASPLLCANWIPKSLWFLIVYKARFYLTMIQWDTKYLFFSLKYKNNMKILKENK